MWWTLEDYYTTLATLLWCVHGTWLYWLTPTSLSLAFMGIFLCCLHTPMYRKKANNFPLIAKMPPIVQLVKYNLLNSGHNTQCVVLFTRGQALC